MSGELLQINLNFSCNNSPLNEARELLLFTTVKAKTPSGRGTSGGVQGAADTARTGPYPTNTECEPISWR